MSKKNPAQHVNGEAKGLEIKVPPVSAPIAGNASDDQLANLQDSIFGKKEEVAPPAEVEKPQPRKKAEQIFSRAQEASKKVAQPKEKPVEETPEDFSMVDTLSFLTADESTEEENPRTGEEDDDDEGEELESEPQDDGDLDRENNIRNLRTSAKTARSENATLKARIAELERAAAEQPAVATLQSQLNTARQRIEQLQQYETLFALHDNPEFKSKFIEGARGLTAEMKAIAKDYGVEESVIDEVLTLSNRREIDEFLSENFDSDQARQDVKVLKQKYDGLQRERKEFEKKPGETFAQFEARKAENETRLLQERDAHFTRIKNEGWSSAIMKNAELPNDSKIYELVEIPGKKDHNEKVVRPTLNGSKQLVDMGLDYIERAIRKKAVLSPQFVEWFATICQQATAAQMINASRLGIHRKYQEKIASEGKQRSMERPGLSTGARSTGGESAKKPKDGKDVAAAIFQSVMEEARE